MSEVKNYASDPCNSRFVTWVAVKHGGSELGEVVIAQDFDRVTAERDAALAENKLLRDFSNKQAEHLQAISKASGAMYFESTPEVVQRICGERDAEQALRTAADERADVLERDKVRIDWLAEQPVDTLYLDDGRIIDIAGRVDLRDAIDAAMAAPEPEGWYGVDCEENNREPGITVRFGSGTEISSYGKPILSAYKPAEGGGDEHSS